MKLCCILQNLNENLPESSWFINSHKKKSCELDKSEIMEALLRNFNLLKRRRFFKYGLPFIVLVVGGSFALREFTTLRYQFSKKRLVDPADLEKEGVKMKKSGEVTLEGEFEKIKKLDIDNWENKRGPRPWEEGT